MQAIFLDCNDQLAPVWQKVLRPDDPAIRKMYLTRFADQESRVYMKRFYTKYHGKTPDQQITLLLLGVRK